MKLIYIMCVVFLLKEVERRCVLLLLTLKPLSLLLCHPLQYTTDDLDYSPFDEYPEGATETSPTYDDFEPQVNGKSEGQDVFALSQSDFGSFVCCPRVPLLCLHSCQS